MSLLGEYEIFLDDGGLPYYKKTVIVEASGLK
jgi:hypothetical protein